MANEKNWPVIPSLSHPLRVLTHILHRWRPGQGDIVGHRSVERRTVPEGPGTIARGKSRGRGKRRPRYRPPSHSPRRGGTGAWPAEHAEERRRKGIDLLFLRVLRFLRELPMKTQRHFSQGRTEGARDFRQSQADRGVGGKRIHAGGPVRCQPHGRCLDGHPAPAGRGCSGLAASASHKIPRRRTLPDCRRALTRMFPISSTAACCRSQWKRRLPSTCVPPLPTGRRNSRMRMRSAAFRPLQYPDGTRVEVLVGRRPVPLKRPGDRPGQWPLSPLSSNWRHSEGDTRVH